MLDIPFEVDEPIIDEAIQSDRPPAVLALELAKQKALARAVDYDQAFVLGADTIVALQDRILGKPEDAAEAARMLRSLSGRTHHVFTAFALVNKPQGSVVTGCERTAVTFRKLTAAEIDSYVESGSPMDKAGAYGIQDQSAVFVKRIDGCFYNVVGFPLARFYTTCLENFRWMTQ